MLRMQHAEVYERDSAGLFDALVRALAKRRWAPQRVDGEVPLPRRDGRYQWQTSSALRSGRVLEFRRPLFLTLDETLDDPPCRVTLRMRWRIDDVADGSQLRLELRYSLNGAATIRRRHWQRRLRRHCQRMFDFVGAEILKGRAEETAAHYRDTKL